MKCCDLVAGKLRHVIALQKETNVPDGAGGNKLGWETYDAFVRALINPVSASERLYAMRLEHNVSHKCFIRYRTDIRSDHSVLYNGRRMQIRGIVNIEEANKWLELRLEEGAVN